ITIDPHAGWSGSIRDLLPSLTAVDGHAVVDNSGNPFETPYEALVGMATYSKGADAAVVPALDAFARFRTGYAIHIPSAGYPCRLKLVNLDAVQQQLQLTLNGVHIQRTIPPRGRLDE